MRSSHSFSTYREEYNDSRIELKMARYGLGRSSTETPQRRVDDLYAIQGKVFWLPAKEYLPERAVRRAHGKGAVEEGIYNRPIVAISHPVEESDFIHFHFITSLQGKRLDQLYAKSNEFHASRRSWYLPVAPTPDHPDALSKKTKKRFPTLELANGAMLRWDSYVNIRHVYKVKISLLQEYTNADTPDTKIFRFERESMIRMLAKGKTLTMYEPGPQCGSSGLTRVTSAPTDLPREVNTRAGRYERETESPTSDAASAASEPLMTQGAQGDFHMATSTGDGIPGPVPKVPPDAERKFAAVSEVYNVLVQPVEHFIESVKSLAIVASNGPVAQSLAPTVIRQPLDRFWRDLKGLTAVAIASL